MYNIKNAYACLKHCLSKIHYLLLVACGLLPCSAFSSDWGTDTMNDVTVAKSQKLNYRPTISFCIERDETTGKFHAFNTDQARFNRVWMEQNSAKHGSQATKELIKMGFKAIYKSFYKRSAGAKRFLPDEEGRVAVSNYSDYKTDYSVHLSSDSLTFGLALAF